MKKILILIVTFILLASISSADMGPKPTAHFDITLNGQAIPEKSFSAAMLICGRSNDASIIEQQKTPDLAINLYDSERNCYWNPSPLAWGGNRCSDSACNFNYFLPAKFRLGVYLPSLNKTFLSEETTRNNFNSYFFVDLKTDGTMDIKETTPFYATALFKSFLLFLFAFALTTAIEIVVALIYVSIWKIKGLLKYVIYANLITLPLLWIAVTTIPLPYSFIAFIVGEIIIMIFEGYFIYHFNKELITYKRSAIMSITMNLASMILGGVVMVFISFFFGAF